jgi:hypothetical protein
MFEQISTKTVKIPFWMYAIDLAARKYDILFIELHDLRKLLLHFHSILS